MHTQGSDGDWKTLKMKLVMEKSWNMKNWPEVMEFCDSVMEFYQFCPHFVLNLYFFWVTTKKLGRDLESLHFRSFSAKCHKFKIRERDGHGKSRNGHGKVIEKYFVNSVRILIQNLMTGESYKLDIALCSPTVPPEVYADQCSTPSTLGSPGGYITILTPPEETHWDVNTIPK